MRKRSEAAKADVEMHGTYAGSSKNADKTENLVIVARACGPGLRGHKTALAYAEKPPEFTLLSTKMAQE